VSQKVKGGAYADAIAGSKALKTQAEDILKSLGGQ
jgi:hypothetical protein